MTAVRFTCCVSVTYAYVAGALVTASDDQAQARRGAGYPRAGGLAGESTRNRKIWRTQLGDECTLNQLRPIGDRFGFMGRANLISMTPSRESLRSHPPRA